MLTELPKIFDRNFVIAFLLPATLFLFFILLLLDQTPWSLAVRQLFGEDTWFGVSTLGVASFVLAILLAGFNYGFIRFLEGYLWPLNKLGFLRDRQLRLCNDLDDSIKQLEAKIKRLAPQDKAEIKKLLGERAKLMQQRVTRFPDSESFILPTAFGNVVRAFESYPRVVYGLDGIPAWPRLQGIMSDRTAAQVGAAKAPLDLFVNLFYLAVLFFIVVIACAIHLSLWQLLACVLVLPLAAGSLTAARHAAVQWGEYVKSAFDLHIAELAESFGMELPEDAEKRREVWVRKSQSMIYHLPEG